MHILFLFQMAEIYKGVQFGSMKTIIGHTADKRVVLL